MGSVIKGMTVMLHQQVQTGTDPFGAPVFETQVVPVENVLAKPSDSANIDTDAQTRLYGRRVRYDLAIPKGDTHDWENTKVEFFGHVFRTVGYSVLGVEENIPLDWNRKVHVELYG